MIIYLLFFTQSIVNLHSLILPYVDLKRFFRTIYLSFFEKGLNSIFYIHFLPFLTDLLNLK